MATEVWEYGFLYFVRTVSLPVPGQGGRRGQDGPWLAVFRRSSGVVVEEYGDPVEVFNQLGADGWVIDEARPAVGPPSFGVGVPTTPELPLPAAVDEIRNRGYRVETWWSHFMRRRLR